MKRILALIAVAALVLSVATPASAFVNGELVQYIYEGTTDAGNEYSTSMGMVQAGDLTASRTITANQPAADLGDFLAADWSDMYAGFTTQYSTQNNWGSLPFQTDRFTYLFYATTDATATYNTAAQATFSQNAAGLVATGVESGQAKTTAVSYWNNIELGGSAIGVYAGFNPDSNGTVSLAALDGGIGSSVTMYLYEYLSASYFSGSPDGSGVQQGLIDLDGEFITSGPQYIATLTIGLEDDGTGNAQLYTQINPVPVPAALWLLGSGLLGLIGIRRRNA